MLNRDPHAPSETPPIPTATPLTLWPRLLHYINSAGLRCLQEPFADTDTKGGTALETRSQFGPLNNRGINLLTHPPGRASPPPSPPAHGGAFGSPRARARARVRVRARSHSRACTYARRALPGPGKALY